MKSKYFSRKKNRIYKTVIQPNMGVKNFKNRAFRTIAEKNTKRGIKIDGPWKGRNNRELEELYSVFR